MLRAHKYGRLLEEFEVGATYEHPWEVTIDEGMLALFAASFQDALPTYSSRVFARGVGLRDRPVHPLFLLNFGMSAGVHDLSEQAIANLAYIDVRFPAACYPGDTLRARSKVLGVKPVSHGDKGVVHALTQVENERGELVCSFERKALARGGRGRLHASEGAAAPPTGGSATAWRGRAPAELDLGRLPELRASGLPTYFEDVEVGDVFAHSVGRTVSEAEPMQLATLLRNSHPLHLDELYCRDASFAKTRVVFGGLVLAWALALSSRDTAGNAVWDLGLDEGAHTGGVLAGDTLFAATKVLAKRARSDGAGELVLRVVGLKNATARAVIEARADLFTPELGKTEGRVPEKVVEVTRTLLVRTRGKS